MSQPKMLDEYTVGEIIRVFNLGYHEGHCATVEGTFVNVLAVDMDSYHEDLVREIIDAIHPPKNTVEESE